MSTRDEPDLPELDPSSLAPPQRDSPVVAAIRLPISVRRLEALAAAFPGTSMEGHHGMAGHPWLLLVQADPDADDPPGPAADRASLASAVTALIGVSGPTLKAALSEMTGPQLASAAYAGQRLTAAADALWQGGDNDL